MITGGWLELQLCTALINCTVMSIISISTCAYTACRDQKQKKKQDKDRGKEGLDGCCKGGCCHGGCQDGRRDDSRDGEKFEHVLHQGAWLVQDAERIPIRCFQHLHVAKHSTVDRCSSCNCVERASLKTPASGAGHNYEHWHSQIPDESISYDPIPPSKNDPHIPRYILISVQYGDTPWNEKGEYQGFKCHPIPQYTPIPVSHQPSLRSSVRATPESSHPIPHYDGYISLPTSSSTNNSSFYGHRPQDVSSSHPDPIWRKKLE